MRKEKRGKREVGSSNKVTSGVCEEKKVLRKDTDEKMSVSASKLGQLVALLGIGILCNEKK